jgi:homoserine kinase
MKSIRVTVPATSANLGPGFDSLGLSLGLHNTVELSRTECGLTVEIQGEGAGTLPTDNGNGIVRAAYAVFDRLGEQPGGLHFSTVNRIPPCSGLGSSAAALVAGIVATNALLDEPLSRDEAMHLAVELEGHPDNVAAAMHGGLTVSSYADGVLVTRRVRIAPMEVVVVLPALDVSTAEQRAALPPMVPLKDAAANIGRAALVVQALAEGDLDLLAQVMRDRLHEPTRKQAIPGFDAAIDAALEAGAAAGTISGAGPALIAFARTGHEQIRQALEGALRRETGSDVRSWVLPVDAEGVRVTAA